MDHTDKIPIDQLAQLDSERSVLFFGVVPVAVVGVLAIICVVLYFYRKGRNWNDLGEAMRIDEGDKPVSGNGPDGFDTQDMVEMDPTKPSQRISHVSKSE